MAVVDSRSVKLSQMWGHTKEQKIPAKLLLQQIEAALTSPRRKPRSPAIYFHTGDELCVPAEGLRTDFAAPTPDRVPLGSMRGGARVPVSHTRDALARLDMLNSHVSTSVVNLGNLPNSPNTFRGRAGRIGVVMLRRLMLWQMDQLVRFAAAVQVETQEHATLLKRMVASDQQKDEAISELQEQVKDLRRLVAELQKPEASPADANGGALLKNGVGPRLAPTSFPLLASENRANGH